MKWLLLVATVGISTGLAAQTHDSDGLPFSLGSDIVGECVDTALLVPHLSIRANGGTYYVDGRSLYVDTAYRFWSDDRSGCLVRIAEFDFDVRGIDAGGGFNQYLEFWTGEETWRFRPETGELERFSPRGALDGFLLYPIVSATGTIGGYGCHGSGSSESVSNIAVEIEDAVPSLRHESRPLAGSNERGLAINNVDLADLTRVLRAVNHDPDWTPSLAECQIPDADLAVYVEKVESEVERWQEIQDRGEEVLWFDLVWGSLPTTDSRDVYLRLVSEIETVGPDIVREALRSNRDGAGWFFTSYSRVVLVNEVNDSLTISFSIDGIGQPFNLPWKISGDTISFRTYNIELARMLMKFLPERKWRKEANENVQLLYTIAGYLYRSRRDRGD